MDRDRDTERDRPLRPGPLVRSMALGAVSLAGLATCGDNTVYVRVNVSSLPAKTTRVALRPFVGSVSYGQELFDVASTDATLVVGFKLPGGTQGQFRVDVEPRGADGQPVRLCDLAYAGSATADIVDPRATSVDVKVGVTVPPSGLTKDFYAIWGSASDNVWAVGDGGQIGHWNGCYWKSVLSGTQSTLRGVHGFVGSPGEIWAVGGDNRPSGGVAIVHSVNGGSTFTASGYARAGQLNDVWGSSPTKLWAVGGDASSDGLILANTSGMTDAWSPVTDSSLTTTGGTTVAFLSIDGLDSNRVYAVGKATTKSCSGSSCVGSIATYNGTQWSRPMFMDNGLANLSHVYADPTGVVWLGGDSGHLADWDTSMSGYPIGTDVSTTPYQLMAGLIGFPPVSSNGLFYSLTNSQQPGVLQQFQSGGARAVSVTGDAIDVQTKALWGTSPTDIWIVGVGGVRYHFDGTALKRYADPQ